MQASPRPVLLNDAQPDSTLELGGALFSIDLTTLADGSKAPPSEIRLFKAGVNETTKGPVLMSERAGRSVLAKVAELGRDRLNFDYGHAQLGFVQSYESARSAGWFKVDVRGSGDAAELWATDIQWTKTAHKALADREFRYFSPAVMLDRESGEVRELINVALTNIPATKHQTPLVASQTPAAPAPKDQATMDLATLLSALQIKDAPTLVATFQKLSADNAALVKAAAEMQTQLSTATTELAAFKDAQSKADKAAFVAQLSSQGKLAPALRDWALGQSLEVLKAYAEAAPVAAVASQAATTTPPKGETQSTLSDDERNICSQLGITEKDYLATKAELLASRNPWIYTPAPEAPEPK
jgi:phage I-like protein